MKRCIWGSLIGEAELLGDEGDERDVIV